MILPAPRNDGRRQRLVSAGGAIVLLVGLHAGLRAAAVPAFGSGRAAIRELDPVFLARYATPPPPEAPGREDEQPVPETETGGLLDEEVGSAIDELARRFEGIAAAPSGTDRARAAARQTGVPDLTVDAVDSRFNELFGGAADGAPAIGAPRRAGAPRGIATGGVELATRAGRPRSASAVADDPGGIEVAVDQPTGRGGAAAPTDVVIRDYQPETLNRSEVEVLGEWMEQHPADLPVGVKVHLNFMASFLTAAVPIATDGRQLDLFLMFNASLRELHILLVEGNQSVYLIDRGFQEQSRSLREGTVRRLDGEIVAVDSRAGAASSDRAREFYNIFLSWWNVAKQDAGRP